MTTLTLTDIDMSDLKFALTTAIVTLARQSSEAPTQEECEDINRDKHDIIMLRARIQTEEIVQNGKKAEETHECTVDTE